MSIIEFNLRDFSINDVDSVAENANNPNVARYLKDFFPQPYTIQDAKDFIECFIPGVAGKIFAIDVEGKAVGAIGLHMEKGEYRFNAELGYWLGENHWNKGIITAAIKQVVQYGFENLEINKIFAKVYETNTVSSIVLVKNGFKLEARMVKHVVKNGVLLDVLFYTKFRE